MNLHEFHASQRRREYALIAFLLVASGVNFIVFKDSSTAARVLGFFIQLAIVIVSWAADRMRRRRQPPTTLPTVPNP